jgi:hydroxymethylglutaryl-CoA lyase
MLTAAGNIVERARAHEVAVSVTIGASFGRPFEGEVPVKRVVSIAEQAGAALGGHEIALADTIGVPVLADVRERVRAVRDVTDLPLRAHLHNTHYANALTAVEVGASTGGIGGCSFAPRTNGNIATEDLVYQLRRSGIDARVDLKRLVSAAAVLGEELDITLLVLPGRDSDFQDDAPSDPFPQEAA